MTFRDKNVKFAKHMNIAPEAFSTPVISVELSEDVAGRKRKYGGVPVSTKLTIKDVRKGPRCVSVWSGGWASSMASSISKRRN